MLDKTAPCLLIAFVCAATPQGLLAAEQCPLIRPVGLTPEQVRMAAIQSFERSIQRPIRESDLTKPVADLVGLGNARLAYFLSAGEVGELLGFDALKEFNAAAERLGKSPPEEHLPISALLDVTLSTYKRGKDSPLPMVTPNAVYRIATTKVHVPAPADGWRLASCRSYDVTFLQPRSDGQSTATVRIASLRPERSDLSFLENVRSLMEASLPRGAQVKPWSPKLVRVNRSRCAEIETEVRLEERAVTTLGRVCEGANGSTLGHVALFADNAPKASSFPRLQARRFIEANVPE